MERESEYYVKINGELFLYREIFEKIGEEQLELGKKLYKKEISKEDYKKAFSKHSEIIDKVAKYIITKKEFIEEYLKFKAPLKIAKESWKHEREHFNKVLQQGLTPKIGIAHLIGKDQLDKEKPQIGLKPFVRSNMLDFLEEWSLEKLNQSNLDILEVTDLSDTDTKQKEVLKNTKIL